MEECLARRKPKRVLRRSNIPVRQGPPAAPAKRPRVVPPSTSTGAEVDYDISTLSSEDEEDE